jgi:hypothetical protein
MPTKPKPRLAISLTLESRAALERLTKVSGIAASQFVASMVHDAIPIIEATANALEIAKTSPRKAGELMNTQFISSVSKISQAKLELDETVNKKLRKRPVKRG